MYRYKLMTQTQVGKLFGVSSHVVGRWLVEIGLRNDRGRPSLQAHQGGYCETAPSHGSGYHWAWHAEKTVTALEAAGHRRVSPAPVELVEPPRLLGPFTTRQGEGGQIEVVGADGNVGVLVSGERNANSVVALMNLAHRHGKLGAMT
jgi:hypothetical protein